MKANIEFRIYDTYISGPPFEEKNPPSSESAYGLASLHFLALD